MQSLFTILKEYRMAFRAGLRDPCMHEGCRETFGKRKNTRAAGECIFTLSESRAASQVHGSRYSAWKTIW
jgi:hypothetical protein